MNWKYYLVGFIFVIVVVFYFFFLNVYISSPGYATPEGMREFKATHPSCLGISILLNEQETYTDFPGRSLCVGFLSQPAKQ